MKTENFWNIGKRSIQTVSSSKQNQVSETLVSSQDLNYVPYFKTQYNKLQAPSVSAYSTVVQNMSPYCNTNKNYQMSTQRNVETLDSIATLTTVVTGLQKNEM